MKTCVFVVALAAVLAKAADGQVCSTYSLLGNIDCGGGQRTCYQSKTGISGGVRCTCSAACSAGNYLGVVATSLAQWGTPENCTFSLTGTAKGGTKSVGSTWSTAVFTSASLSYNVTFNLITLTTNAVGDCYQGQIEADPPITPPC